MFKIKAFLIGCCVVLFSCGENKQKNSEQQENPTQPESQAQPETLNEDLLRGEVVVNVGGEKFTLTEFNKKRTEITWMKDNQMNIRLTSLDKEQRIQLLLSGPDIYNKEPLDVSLNATDYKKTNHGGLSLEGFTGDKEKVSMVRIIEGSGTVEELDREELDFAMSFTGTALNIRLGSKNDTVQVSGKINIQLDNAVETRQNQK